MTAGEPVSAVSLAGDAAARVAGLSAKGRPIGVRGWPLLSPFKVLLVVVAMFVSSIARRCRVENLSRVLLAAIRLAMFAAIASLRVINLWRDADGSSGRQLSEDVQSTCPAFCHVGHSKL